MANQPQPAPKSAPKPQSPPPKAPEPSKAPEPAKAPPPSHEPPARHEGKAADHRPPTIGAIPDDPDDPQAKKFEPASAPPRWDKQIKPKHDTPEWWPKAALDPLAEKPPEGVYADGMSAPDEQRARAAWVEEHGLASHQKAVDQRPDEDKPEFDEHALAGGGAFVSHGAQKQVQGVAPPAKRS
jgi:hypothetical protein